MASSAGTSVTTRKAANKTATPKKAGRGRSASTRATAQPTASAQPPASGLVAGDLLAVQLEDGGWGACLVLGSLESGLLDVLSLAWTGDVAPTEPDLREVGPLFRTHHAWGSRPHRQLERHRVDDEPPPEGWRRIGTRVLPALPESAPSGAAWESVGYQIGLQRDWDIHLPAEAREAYREAERHRKDELRVTLGGPEAHLTRGTWRLSIGPGCALAPPTNAQIDWRALDPFGALTEVDYTGADDTIVGWLATRPLVGTLHWHGHGRERIDLSRTHLSAVHLHDLDATASIVLPSSARRLWLDGVLHARLAVEDSRGGRGLTLVRDLAEGELGFIAGLDGLTQLEVWHARAVPAGVIARFPALRKVVLRADLGTLLDGERLGELRHLEALELHDFYGYDFASLPAAEIWPSLRRVEIAGFRKSAQPLLKEKLADVRDLSLRGAKTDAWLAANLDNPFRDWVDQDAAKGRKAAASWTKRRSAIAAAASPTEKKAVLEAFIGDFNQLDAKHGLDTIDREEVGEAFAALTEAAGLGDETDALFDAWRDF
jgi:hypothetical protein